MMGKYKTNRFGIGALIFSIWVTGCSADENADQIVNQSIEAHGGDRFEAMKVAFDFRGRHYTGFRNKSEFVYTREFSDSLGQVKDVLTNSSFTRYINGEEANLTDERKNAFTNSVNSVLYFALLPYGLNGPAVNKRYLGETTLRDKTYSIIEVTFDEDGGGEDYQDVFRYWINRENHRVDFFAYTYETDGGGIRFREAVRPRMINGILFQDYINYKPKDEKVPLAQLEQLFLNGELEILSEIKLENIHVEPLNN